MDAQSFLTQLHKTDKALRIPAEDLLAEETPDGFCYSTFFDLPQNPQEEDTDDAIPFLLRMYVQEDGHLKRCTVTYALQEGEEATAFTAKARERFRHLCETVTAAYTKCNLQTANTLLRAHFQEETDGLRTWEENWFRYSLLETSLGLSFTLESVRLNPADKDAPTLRKNETTLSSAAQSTQKP